MKILNVKLTDPEKQIYDGDTIERVEVKLFDYTPIDFEQEEEVWPDLIQKEDGVYAKFNLRLYGIDTPEMHPHHKDAHGNKRSEESLTLEKEKAKEARQALIDLLKETNYEFHITDAIEGKYAGRIVCRIFVNKDGKIFDISHYLIEKGLGIPYFGGHKMPWS